MIPYDEVDKTNWVSIPLDWDQETIDKISALAAIENRTIEDWISKTMYEWYHTQLENGALEENYTKIEIPIYKEEDKKDEQV